MVNFLKPTIANSLVACITAFTFTTAVMTPYPAHATNYNLDLPAVKFGIKAEKIFKKIKNCIDTGDTNKIISYMFDLKSEVEQYSGKKIDLNKAIEQAQVEARAKGQKINDKHIKEIKKKFGLYNKKLKNRDSWFVQCSELDIPYSTLEADNNFEMNYLTTKASSKKNEEEKEEVPITVMVGVTVTLCGIFLYFVPIPVCQTAGGWLISSGVSILSGDAIKHWDDHDQEKRKKINKKKDSKNSVIPPTWLFCPGTGSE